MNSRTLAMILAVCISILVISAIVRTEFFVLESVLPLYERQVVTVDNFPL